MKVYKIVQVDQDGSRWSYVRALCVQYKEGTRTIPDPGCHGLAAFSLLSEAKEFLMNDLRRTGLHVNKTVEIWEAEAKESLDAFLKHRGVKTSLYNLPKYTVICDEITLLKRVFSLNITVGEE